MTHVAQPRGANWCARDFDLMHGPDALARRLHDTGFTGVAINVVHPDAARILRLSGLDVWAYGLPGQWDPESLAHTTAVTRALCEKIDCGAMSNAEKPYGDGKHWDDAGNALCSLLDAGIPTGIATFDGLHDFALHTAKMIGLKGGWGSVERYHRELGAPLNYWHEAFYRWETYGFAMVAPFFGVFPASGHAHDPATYVRVYDSYPSPKVVPSFTWPTHVPFGVELDALKRYTAR